MKLQHFFENLMKKCSITAFKFIIEETDFSFFFISTFTVETYPINQFLMISR
jgi:hypothetical protein